MNELDGSRGSPRHSRLKDFIPNYDGKLDPRVVKLNFEVLTKSIFLRHQKHYRQTSLLIKVNILQISNCLKRFIRNYYLQAFQHKFRLDLDLNT